MAKRAARTCVGFWERRRNLVVVALLTVAVGVVASGDALARADAQPSEPAVGSEIPSLRTADSRTFVGPDGTLAAHVYSESVNYKDANGTWQHDDNTLVAASDDGAPGLTNAANAFDVLLPQTLGLAPVTVTSGNYSVSFSLDDATGSATTSGATATYPGALPGVDLRYTVGNTRLEEDLVLAGPSSPSTFTYSVSTSPGLTAHRATDGSIQFVDASGKPRLWFFAPNMVDAAGESGPASFSLASTDSGYQVTLTADASWLASPERAWPVTIDPGAMGEFWDQSAYPTVDGYVTSGDPNTAYFSGTTDVVGEDADTFAYRSLMKFNTESILTQNGGRGQVLNAELKMYLSARSTTTSAAVGVYDVTRSFTNAASWNKYDGTHTWTTAGGDRTTDPASGLVWGQTNVGATGAYYTWNVTRLVEGWNDGTIPDNGLTVKKISETSSVNLYTFKNARATSNLPYIAITYYNRAGDFAQDTYRTVPLTDSLNASINVGNGSIDLCQNDLNFPGVAGFGLTLNRCIDSTRAINFEQMDGYWFMTPGVETWLEPVWASGDTGSGVGTLIYHGDSGDLEPFTPAGTGSTYLGPTGFNATLATASGSLCGGTKAFVLTFRSDGSKRYFRSATGYDSLLAEQDRNGNTICFAYGIAGLSSITDTQGRTISFHYASIGGGDYRLGSLTAPGPASCPSGTCTYTYGYHTDGTLANLTDPTGAETQYTYSAAGQLATITDPNGNTSNFTWTAVQGGYRIATIVDANSNTTHFTYGDTGGGFCSSGSTNITDPANSTPTRYCFDAGLRVTSVKAPDGSVSTTDYTNAHGGSGCTDTYTDSLNAAPCATQSGNGYWTTYGYDSTGQNRLWKQNPVQTASQRSTWAYGDNTHPYSPTSSADANGNTTTYTYTSTGNVATETDGAGYTTSYTYNTNGGLATKQTGLLRNTQTGALTCPSGTPNPICPKTAYGYDSQGNQTEQTVGLNDLNRVTSYAYDAAGNQTSEIDGQTLDASLNVVCPTDATCSVTSETFDGMSRVLTETNPVDQTMTKYTYDGNGNPTSQTSGLSYDPTTHTYNCPSGSTCPMTSDTYGADNTLLGETAPDTPAASYTYDANGNEVTETIGTSGTATQYFYNSRNKQTMVQEPGCTEIACSAQYTYDADGNVLTELDPDGYETVNYYDHADQLTQVIYGRLSWDSSQGKYVCASGDTCPVTTYAYDPAGNQTSVTDSDLTNSNVSQTRRFYDGDNRVHIVRTNLDSSGQCPTGVCPQRIWTYDNNGNDATVTDPDSTQTQYQYDAANEVITVTSGLTSAGTPPTYSCAAGDTCPTTTGVYDNAGNLSSQQTQGASSIDVTATTTSLPDGGTLTSYNLPDGSGMEAPTPPASFNPLTASAAQLEEYAFPPRPTNTADLATWTAQLSGAPPKQAPDATPSIAIPVPPPDLSVLSASAEQSASSSSPYPSTWAGYDAGRPGFPSGAPKRLYGGVQADIAVPTRSDPQDLCLKENGMYVFVGLGGLRYRAHGHVYNKRLIQQGVECGDTNIKKSDGTTDGAFRPFAEINPGNGVPVLPLPFCEPRSTWSIDPGNIATQYLYWDRKLKKALAFMVEIHTDGNGNESVVRIGGCYLRPPKLPKTQFTFDGGTADFIVEPARWDGKRPTPLQFDPTLFSYPEARGFTQTKWTPLSQLRVSTDVDGDSSSKPCAYPHKIDDVSFEVLFNHSNPCRS